MRYVLITALAFVALILFLPAQGSMLPRNLPLLATLLALLALCAIITVARHIILLWKAKQLCKQRGMTIDSSRLCLVRGHLHGRLVGHMEVKHKNPTVTVRDEKRYCILFLVRRRSYWRYHFELPERLEFYRSHRVATRVNRVSYHIARDTTTQPAGRQRLSWGKDGQEADAKLIVMNKLPLTVSDSNSRQELSNGDEICASGTYLYDFTVFPKALDRLLSNV
ncbi:MAG: hypothetical protein IJY20_05060 [Clostridia bacterium]|nr:hypothetical protein [Clostridia bacterium]